VPTTAEPNDADSRPWAIRPREAVLAAKLSSMCTGLKSSDASAKRLIRCSVTVTRFSAAIPIASSSKMYPPEG
jgi:hypothetical protein